MHLIETLRVFQQIRHMYASLGSPSVEKHTIIVSQTSFGPHICYPPCYRQGCLFHEAAKIANL